MLGLQLPELASLVEEFGQPVYRARQLFEALYRQRVETPEQISTLPQDFRRSLSERGISVGLPDIEKKFVSGDGTVRYLVGCADGQSVETVWMPEGDGGEAGDGSEAGNQTEMAGRTRERATICVSSQVGCAVDCKFCLTARMGLERTMTRHVAAELAVGQADAARHTLRTGLLWCSLGAVGWAFLTMLLAGPAARYVFGQPLSLIHI